MFQQFSLAGDFVESLGLSVPIVQAPMAGATSADFVARVSNLGALGSLGAGMMQPALLADQILAIKAQTDRAFAVNLMVLQEEEWQNLDAPMPVWLQTLYQDLGLSPTLPNNPAPNFDQQFEVLLNHSVPVASFTFNLLSVDRVQALHQVGTWVVGTANHPLEAQAWAEVGADAVCLQGSEAGGHRGGWLPESAADPLGLLTLISQTRQILPNIKPITLIGAGGLMTAQDVQTVQTAGAQLAQLGTAFLTTHESAIDPIYKNALLQAGKAGRTTQLTRLFSGKLARGLLNDFMTRYAQYDNAQDLPLYPQQNAMTQPLRAHAKQTQNAAYQSLWAGQNVAQTRSESLADLIARLTID